MEGGSCAEAPPKMSNALLHPPSPPKHSYLGKKGHHLLPLSLAVSSRRNRFRSQPWTPAFRSVCGDNKCTSLLGEKRLLPTGQKRSPPTCGSYKVDKGLVTLFKRKFKLIQIKYKKINSSVIPATFQVLGLHIASGDTTRHTYREFPSVQTNLSKISLH